MVSVGDVVKVLVLEVDDEEKAHQSQYETSKGNGMNGQGIIIAVVSFLCIGLFHPLVIWFEYHFTSEYLASIFDRGPALPDRRAFHPGPFLCPSGAAGCCLHMEHPGTEGAVKQKLQKQFQTTFK